MKDELSESLEDYLEAIAELTATEGHAHTKAIAARLNVRMPSVTSALRSLKQQGLINYDRHYPVMLTEAGRKIADSVITRHRTLKAFFNHFLAMDHARASTMACRIEHILDADAFQRFQVFINAIGQRSDSRSLKIYLTEAMEYAGRPDGASYQVLSRLSPGEQAAFVAFGRNITQPPVVLHPGQTLLLQGIALDYSSYQVLANTKVINLPLNIAENLWVRRLTDNSGATPVPRP